MRGFGITHSAGGRSVRSRALIVAVGVLLAVALVTTAVVVAATISGGPGYQVINGTPRNDVIRARDDGPDTIDCGAGIDTVYVDRSEDGVFNCEKVVTP